MVASRVMPALFTMTFTDPNAAVGGLEQPHDIGIGGNVAADADGVGAQ